MSKCLNCGADIENLEGRRPKKFCDNKGKCRGEYWRKNNPKNPKYVNIKTHTAEIEKLKKQLEAVSDNRNNEFINAARGRDESGINNDEIDYSAKIKEYETELTTLAKGGNVAGYRRLFIEKEIKRLQKLQANN